MESTIIKCTCVSKKESSSYDANNPIQTAIELQPPYDQSNIYWQMSGGSNFLLNTKNKAAADIFEIGKTYDVVISPSEK